MAAVWEMAKSAFLSIRMGGPMNGIGISLADPLMSSEIAAFPRSVQLFPA